MGSAASGGSRLCPPPCGIRGGSDRCCWSRHHSSSATVWGASRPDSAFAPVIGFVNAYRADPRPVVRRMYLSCGAFEPLVNPNRAMAGVFRAGPASRSATRRRSTGITGWTGATGSATRLPSSTPAPPWGTMAGPHHERGEGGRSLVLATDAPRPEAGPVGALPEPRCWSSRPRGAAPRRSTGAAGRAPVASGRRGPDQGLLLRLHRRPRHDAEGGFARLSRLALQPVPAGDCGGGGPGHLRRLRGTQEVVAAGASIGAFNALALLCRYPHLFRTAIGMSGTYDIEGFIGGGSEDLYHASPLQFLPGLGGPHRGAAAPALLRARLGVRRLGERRPVLERGGRARRTGSAQSCGRLGPRVRARLADVVGHAPPVPRRPGVRGGRAGRGRAPERLGGNVGS